MASNLKDLVLEKISYSDIKSFYSQYLEIGKTNSKGDVKCVCCFHEETNASLSINLFTGQYICFGCGEKGDLFTFYQKKKGCNFPAALTYFADLLSIVDNRNGSSGQVSANSKKAKAKAVKGEIECVYDYQDLTGKTIHQTVRYKNPKSFSQRQPHPTKPGEYQWNLQGVTIIPYNLKAVSASKTVYIVEGEKDCDNLSKIGLTASCNCMGAGKWPGHLSEYFRDKEIIIIPDNDDPGRSHAQLVANKLSNIAESIKIITLDGLNPGGDVSDWLAAGHTKDELIALSKTKDAAFESHIDYLNKLHAAIMIGGKFFIMNHEYDPIFDRPDVTFSSAKDFLLRYQNKRIPNPLAGLKGQPKEISIAKDWLASTERKQYSKLVFSPNNHIGGDYYNLWRGMACEPKQGDWSLFKDHIFKIIASGDKFIFEWILTWLARICQDPGGERPGTAIVLRGEQGVGKGCFLSNFGKLFGNHYMQINNQKQLISRFNNHLKDVIFLFVDEGFWAGDKGGEGVLKGLITEDTLSIESKGKDIITIKNHINLVMASNNSWVVPTGFGERRFFVLNVSADRKQDLKYFSKIFKQMESGGRAAMLYDLLQYDITKVDIKTFPQTDAGIEQLTSSISSVQQFWFDKLRDGVLSEKSEGWDSRLLCSDFYAEYIEYCNNVGIRRRQTPNQFGKELKFICPGLNRIKFSITPVERKWHYEFPYLEVCRNDFLQMSGVKNFDWEKEKIINI